TTPRDLPPENAYIGGECQGKRAPAIACHSWPNSCSELRENLRDPDTSYFPSTLRFGLRGSCHSTTSCDSISTRDLRRRFRSECCGAIGRCGEVSRSTSS